jgi:thiol-disulfide isomerase/thioredoxin
MPSISAPRQFPPADLFGDIDMFNSKRVLALIALSLALVGAWLAYGGGNDSQQAIADEPAAGDDMQANLNRAAEAIVAAAKQGVHASQSEEEVLSRTDLSVETLRLLGELGAENADALAGQLLDEVQNAGSPAVKEVIVRMRLARELQRWSQLTRGEREKAINRFVSDVNAEGLTPSHADLITRLSDNLEMSGQRELARDAVTSLLPAFQNATEPVLQRRAPLMEGVARRLDIIGKPLELEGTLLDGAEFDWASYRGKVVLVDFFANWCEVCREEVPTILHAYRAYKDKGFEVVGVSLDRSPALADAYRRQTGFQFPTLFSADPRALEWNNPLAVKYGITALPRAILVDQEGNVVETIARGPRLGQYLRELLGPAAGAPLGGRVGATSDGPAEESDEESGLVPVGFEEQRAAEEAPAEPQ